MFLLARERGIEDTNKAQIAGDCSQYVLVMPVERIERARAYRIGLPSLYIDDFATP